MAAEYFVISLMVIAAAAPVVVPAPGTQVTDDTHEAWSLFLTGLNSVVSKIEGALDTATRLSMIEYNTLATLRAAPGGELRMTDLARACRLSRSGQTRAVERLENRQLVHRRANDCDERSVLTALTTRGLAKFNVAQAVYANVVERHFVSVLEPDELAVLAGAFRRLRDGEVLARFCVTPEPTKAITTAKRFTNPAVGAGLRFRPAPTVSQDDEVSS